MLQRCGRGLHGPALVTFQVSVLLSSYLLDRYAFTASTHINTDNTIANSRSVGTSYLIYAFVSMSLFFATLPAKREPILGNFHAAAPCFLSKLPLNPNIFQFAHDTSFHPAFTTDRT